MPPVDKAKQRFLLQHSSTNVLFLFNDLSDQDKSLVSVEVRLFNKKTPKTPCRTFSDILILTPSGKTQMLGSCDNVEVL